MLVRCRCGGTLRVAFECYRDIDPTTGKLRGRTQIPQNPFNNARAIECSECYEVYTESELKDMVKQLNPGRGEV